MQSCVIQSKGKFVTLVIVWWWVVCTAQYDPSSEWGSRDDNDALSSFSLYSATQSRWSFHRIYCVYVLAAAVFPFIDYTMDDDRADGWPGGMPQSPLVMRHITESALIASFFSKKQGSPKIIVYRISGGEKGW